jgi:hypothetical protein
MQNSNPLDVFPLWLLFLLTLLMLLLSAEAGYRAGLAWRRRAPEDKEGPTGAMTSATLALLAFLLAFITGVAVNRYDNRRQLVVNEANSIGTTYLRAGYLDEPQRSEIRELLREYVNLRVSDVEDAEEARLRSEAIHNELWSAAIVVAREDPTPVTSIFITSLNEMIDIHAERVVAIFNTRLPPPVELGIFLAAFVTVAMVGFNNAMQGSRSVIPLVALIVIFSAVMLLIVDLDRATEGLLQVNQQALIDLQTQLNTAPPP